VSAPALWRDLRRFTTARVGLGRVGNGLPTAAHLAFQAAHAAARDAVHAALDLDTLAIAAPDVRVVRSACPDRGTYLARPDLGRRLDDADRAALASRPAPGRLAVVVADGLSATAVHRHAARVLAALLPRLDGAGPVVIATQGRVALGDDIGAALQAEAVAVLIGERPGLTTPDSLGIYLTWAPAAERTDAERNCISNIHAGGLAPDAAAEKLLWLIAAMRRLRLTGIDLKDEQPAPALRDRETGLVSGPTTGDREP
jgi:ethanolamine ammonia-lyase small subunit